MLGAKVNVVPSDAVCTVDSRFLPDESVDDVENEIRSVIHRASLIDENVRVEKEISSSANLKLSSRVRRSPIFNSSNPICKWEECEN